MATISIHGEPKLSTYQRPTGHDSDPRPYVEVTLAATSALGGSSDVTFYPRDPEALRKIADGLNAAAAELEAVIEAAARIADEARS